MKDSSSQQAANVFIQRALDLACSKLGSPIRVMKSQPKRRAPLDIAIPIFNGAESLKVCLASVLNSISSEDHVWLIDDASDDALIPELLNQFAAQWPNTNIIRNSANLGFVATANMAMQLTKNDLVLLNSDTQVTEGWLEHCQDTLARNQRAGIVCPLSNHATILSVTTQNDDNLKHRLASFSSGNIRLPTAVGFCMLISRDLIQQVGGFDSIFSPGYGEENDLSMRALKFGYEIIAADRALVFHRGGGSFDPEKSKQLKINHQKKLDLRWPDYNHLVQSWWQENPLREKIEFLARPKNSTAVVHILHRQYHIGGTERVTRGLIQLLSKHYAQTLIYPGLTNNAWCDFELRSEELCRELMLNNRWIRPSVNIGGWPADLSCAHSEQAVGRVIRGSGAKLVHFHHVLNWDSLLLPLLAQRLGCKVIISVHDFYFNCPIHNQLEYSIGQPCGISYSGADTRCHPCLASYTENCNQAGGANEYMACRHQIVKTMLHAANAVVVPSNFMYQKIMSAFELPADKITIIPHGTEIPQTIPRIPKEVDSNFVLGYFGGDQVLKGSDLVLKIAKRILHLPISIRIYGRIKGYDTSKLPHNVTLCGFYNPGDIGQAMSDVDLCLVPSYYEESYSLIVSESWAHGVPVLTSNRGALIDRVKNGINGWRVLSMKSEDWANAVKKIYNSKEYDETCQQLLPTAVDSVHDSVIAYQELYTSVLINTENSQESPIEGASQSSQFDRLVRQLRTRQWRPNARWYQKLPSKSSGKPIVMGIMRDQWATAQYRLRFPLQQLADSKLIANPYYHYVKKSGFSVIPTIEKSNVKHVLVQPFLSDQGLTMMEQLARQAGMTITLIVDDLWTQLPSYNPVRSMIPSDVDDRLKYAATLSNRMVVTTQVLAARLNILHPNLSVIENALVNSMWPSISDQSTQQASGRIRIGWAGAKQHQADLEFLEPIVKATYKDIDWIFLGMCPESIIPFAHQVYELKPFNLYSQALADAKLDIALAPLVMNDFNRCKSHLKLLEYGILGIPVIASQIDPYDKAPVDRIKGIDSHDWVRAIRELSADSDRRKQQGLALKKWVQKNHLMSNRTLDWAHAIGLDGYVN